MKMESHATPCGGTPQQRYATLHRAIEKGIDSDDVWCELAHVSSRLGNDEEARRCLRRIRDSSRRSKTMRLCFPDEAPRRAAPVAAAAADRRAPAQANPGGALPEHRPGVVDHLLDSVEYLLHQQMPWLVLSTMLSFPLVVGVGGFLTAGGSMLLLAAIAALPGLSVLAVVTAMGHEILRASSEGEEDVPELPPFGRLVRTARDFLCDAGLTLLVFFGPPTMFAIAGAPLAISLPLFLTASYFAPISFALRQVRRDMRPFSPLFLLRAVRRAGAGYAAVALCSTLAFAPALGVAVGTVGRPLWVQIAIVGPLAVLPIYSVARLLGSWLDTQRESLGYLLHGGKQTRRPVVTSTVEQPAAKRSLRRPKEQQEMPDPRRTAGDPKRHPRKQVRTASAKGRRAGRRSEPAPAATRQTPTRTGTARRTQTARSIEGRRPSDRRKGKPADARPAQRADGQAQPMVTGAQLAQLTRATATRR